MANNNNTVTTLQELIREGKMFTLEVKTDENGNTRTTLKHYGLNRAMFIANAIGESEEVGKHNYRVFQSKLDTLALAVNALRNAIAQKSKDEKQQADKARKALQDVYNVYNYLMGTWEKKGKVKTANVKATKDAVTYIMERTVKNVKGIDSKGRIATKTGIDCSAQAFGSALQREVENTYYNLFHGEVIPNTRNKKVDIDRAGKRAKSIAEYGKKATSVSVKSATAEAPIFAE